MKRQEKDRDEITALKLNQDYGGRFRRVHLEIERFFHILMKKLSDDALPRGQGPILGYLVDHSEEIICQKDLEKEFHVSGATISNMLSSMEKSHMIARVPIEDDARRKRILATEEGVQRERRVRRQILQLNQAMVKDFTEEEKKQLMEYLIRVADNIREINDQAQEEVSGRIDNLICGK